MLLMLPEGTARYPVSRCLDPRGRRDRCEGALEKGQHAALKVVASTANWLMHCSDVLSCLFDPFCVLVFHDIYTGSGSFYNSNGGSPS